ncbi:MAG: AAA family ATPase [Candidatus Binatia bacterium]
MGVAGSGKTTLAKKILRQVGATYLDNNHIVDAFFPDTRSGRSYKRLRPHFYRALYNIVEENLRLGNSVLLDVPHVKEMQNLEWRRFIRKLALRARAKLVVIRCICSEQTLRARLRSRAETRDRSKLVHWKKFLAEQPINAVLPVPHLDVDTEKISARSVGRSIRYILDAGRTRKGEDRQVQPHQRAFRAR